MPTLAVAETVQRVEHDRFAQRDEDALRDLDRVVGVGERVHQHRELVAAEPRRGVADADAAHEPLAHDLQQRVARGVAEAVVHGLEVVEVDEQHGEVAAVALEPRRRVLDAVAEQRLVREPGERVVERLVRELVLEPAVLGDVAEAPHPADDFAVDALRQRVALEHAPVLELEQVVALRLGRPRRAPGPSRRTRSGSQSCSSTNASAWLSSRASSTAGGIRHISAKRLFQLVMRPDSVDDEDAVGGRLERRGEHRVRGAQARLRRDAVADVVAGRDQSFDRRVVEQVGDRERERHRAARRRA